MADQFPSAQNFYDAEKDLRTVSAVSNSRDPDTGAEIDTWLTRTGGQTDTLAGRLDKLGIVVVGTTTVGVTLNSANEAVLNNTAGSAGFGNYYSWGGSFSPSGHVVAPGTDPALIGSGYVPRSDIVLRDQLAATGGVALVGNAADNRGEDFTGAISAPGVKSLTTFGGMVVGDNPFAVPGSDFPGTAGLRDAVTVSRKLVNTATDCHAFADKTIIEDASDAGTFGAFDCTTVLRGTNPQSHLMAFQNRADFAGANVVGTHIGYLSWPTATGTGEITNVKSAEFRNVDTLTATIKNYTGLDIDPKGATDSNVGILVRNATVSVTASPPISFNSAQGTLGYSLYAPNGGKAYNKGKVSIGDFGALPADAATPYALNVREAGSSVTASLTASDANGAFLFATGDNRISFFTNASLAGYWGKVADSRAFIAGANTQPLGTTTARWATANLITAPNVSSDETLKDFEDVTEGEVLCAKEVRTMMRKYRLKAGDGKVHFGVGAQSVVAVFEKHGLVVDDYNLISIDDNGFYSVVYEELLCFIMLGL